MYNNKMKITSRPQQSYDLHINDWIIGLEWVVFFIALITVYYAIRSFRASRRQNELSTVPNLTIIVGTTESKGECLQLINHDKRFAYEIKFEGIYFLNKDEKVIEHYKIHLNMNKAENFIGPEAQKVWLSVTRDGEEVEGDFAAFLITYAQQYRRGIVIKFKDAQNLKYFTRVNFNKSKAIILRAPTKITLAWRISLMAQELRDYLNRVGWAISILK